MSPHAVRRRAMSLDAVRRRAKLFRNRRPIRTAAHLDGGIIDAALDFAEEIEARRHRGLVKQHERHFDIVFCKKSFDGRQRDGQRDVRRASERARRQQRQRHRLAPLLVSYAERCVVCRPKEARVLLRRMPHGPYRVDKIPRGERERQRGDRASHGATADLAHRAAQAEQPRLARDRVACPSVYGKPLVRRQHDSIGA